MIIRFLFVLSLCTYTFFMKAEEKSRRFYLQDGSIILGNIIKEHEDFFLVESKIGTIKILKSNINNLIIEVVLQDGSQIRGTILNEDPEEYQLQTQVGLLYIKKKDIISFKKQFENNEKTSNYTSSPYLEKKEKMQEGYSHAIEPLIDIFFDPTGYTFRQGDLYLSGISLAYGLSNTILLSSKLLDFAGLNSASTFNPNFEFKYNIYFLKKNNFDFLSSVGIKFDTFDSIGVNIKKYKITYEDTDDCKLCREKSRELVSTEKNKRTWYKKDEHDNYIPYNERQGVHYFNEYEDINGWKFKFYYANTWSFLMNRGGVFSYHLGAHLEINKSIGEVNWIKHPSFRVYNGFDMDLSRKFKLLGEIFYDPDYYNYINNEKYWGVDIGGMYAFSETFRLLVHVQPYVLGFYWRF